MSRRATMCARVSRSCEFMARVFERGGRISRLLEVRRDDALGAQRLEGAKRRLANLGLNDAAIAAIGRAQSVPRAIAGGAARRSRTRASGHQWDACCAGRHVVSHRGPFRRLGPGRHRGAGHRVGRPSRRRACDHELIPIAPSTDRSVDLSADQSRDAHGARARSSCPTPI